MTTDGSAMSSWPATYSTVDHGPPAGLLSLGMVPDSSTLVGAPAGRVG
ncbi:hypothetical protein [Salinispora arenicola]|nr:hypothetical protein [Salinispora arenicola]